MGSRHAGTRTHQFAVPVPPRTAASRRRPAALLIALVIGALSAALTGGLPGVSTATATAEEAVPVSQLLGSDAEGLGEDTELSPQMAITEVEAQARLAEVAADRAKRAAAAVAAAEEAAPDAVMPIHGAQLTTCYCMRWGVMHWGIDLAAPKMTPEFAAEDGVVLRAGAASGFGQAVYILGASGDVTVYGHMEKILVHGGDVVAAGDRIALEGARGQSTGPHLHFEVHHGGIDGERVDPVTWLRQRGVDV
jgi:hypothetical protein